MGTNPSFCANCVYLTDFTSLLSSSLHPPSFLPPSFSLIFLSHLLIIQPTAAAASAAPQTHESLPSSSFHHHLLGPSPNLLPSQLRDLTSSLESSRFFTYYTDGTRGVDSATNTVMVRRMSHKQGKLNNSQVDGLTWLCLAAA